MSPSSRARSRTRRTAWLSPFVAATAAIASAATAQPVAPPGSPNTAPAYRSALEGYQPFSEQRTASWRDANDTVGRIGGWRAYAKEAQQPEASANTSAPTPGPMRGATPANPPAGHGRHH